MNCVGETLTLQWIDQYKVNELNKEYAMRMAKGILIVVLSGVVCLGCGKTKPPTGGTSGEKASVGKSTNADSADRQPDKVITNSIGMKLVWIPPGTFQMGSNDYDTEKPLHTVTITKGFYMGVYEVTQEQYQKVMGNNPSAFKGNDNLPVETVSWNDAREFCTQLCQKEGKTYRLPTEAEWEYACRAGTTSTYGFGNREFQLGNYAWYDKNSGIATHPVGQKKPNAWGLYDMHGNVWEWCLDWYAKDWYSKGPAENPLNEGYGDMKYIVIRGGGWHGDSYGCRVSYRNGSGLPDSPLYDIGFRVVLGHYPLQKP